MEQYQFSVTALDDFRKYTEDSDYVDEAKLIDRLMGVKKFSAQMTTGTACHAIIEKGIEPFRTNTPGVYMVHGNSKDAAVCLKRNNIKPLLRYRQDRPLMCYEVPVQYTSVVHNLFGSYEYTLNMRIDVINVLEIDDIKTTTREIDVSEYEQSLQWKAYLLATRASIFNYQVFKYNTDNELGDVVIEDPLQIRLYAFDGMAEMVDEYALGLIEFCKQKKLEHRIRAWESKF